MNNTYPIRIDVVILTVNKQEADSVNSKFRTDTPAIEKELNYRWGVHVKTSGERIYIAHVNLDDISGISHASNITVQICDILYPCYILVLGIAGGRQFNKKTGPERVELGDVVVSKIIRHGPISRGSIREIPVMQPDFKLYHYAFDAGQRDDWRRYVSVPPPMETTPKVHFEEHVSLDQIIEDLANTPNLKLAFEKFPRAACVDMEAGGVASTLFSRYSIGKWAPKLFVVKGISDIIDSDISSEEQRDSRQEWRKYAADTAASFTFSLLPSLSTKVMTHPERFLPEVLQDQRLSTSSSAVYYSIKLDHYSKITAHILDRVSNSRDFIRSVFFTFCAYDPKSLWEAARNKFFEENRYFPHNAQLKTWALDQFTHFQTFGDVAKENSKNCFRILLLEGSTHYASGEHSWTNGIDNDCWDFFVKVNCGVPCWGIGKKDLNKRDGVPRDYVIIGDKIRLDYYDESRTLILNEISTTSNQTEKYIFDYFYSKLNSDDPSPFKHIDQLNEEALTVLQKRRKRNV